MPIYEYQCVNCGYRFELRRSFANADDLIICEKCQSSQTKRLLSKSYSHQSGKSTDSPTHSGCSGCSGGSCACCNH